jgi:hypothetical protein
VNLFRQFAGSVVIPIDRVRHSDKVQTQAEGRKASGGARTDSLLARRTDCLKMVPAASGLTERREMPGRDLELLPGVSRPTCHRSLHRIRKPLEEWKRQHIDQIKRPRPPLVPPPGPSPPMSAVGRPCSRTLIPQKLLKNDWNERRLDVSV